MSNIANTSGARIHTFSELTEMFGNNTRILEAVIKTEDHIFTQACEHGKIMVSISGGSDSDIMMDMFERLGYDEGEVVYVWFDTGLEYDTTKRHLKDLEEKYGVEIKRYRPEMTVAQACKKYGIPFLSKEVSEKIERAQKKGFSWASDDCYEILMEKYGKSKAFLKWWCTGIRETKHTVMRHAGLKAFLQQNPPKINISDQCCDAAKKRPVKKAQKELGATLGVVGVRRAESGLRSTQYTTCFSERSSTSIAQFRPLFYFTDQDKQEYKDYCSVTYSDCYEVWGFKRTGCVCCPFGSKFEEELKVVKQYEPKLYAAACKIFGPSYEYTRQYRRFKESYKRERRRHGQIDLFDRPEDQIERKEP